MGRVSGVQVLSQVVTGSRVSIPARGVWGAPRRMHPSQEPQFSSAQLKWPLLAFSESIPGASSCLAPPPGPASGTPTGEVQGLELGTYRGKQCWEKYLSGETDGTLRLVNGSEDFSFF